MGAHSSKIRPFVEPFDKERNPSFVEKSRPDTGMTLVQLANQAIQTEMDDAAIEEAHLQQVCFLEVYCIDQEY